MYLSELKIENYRMFGSDNHALIVPFKPGLTALVGENDTGKTTVIDALRLVLGTRDQEFFRIDDIDFHLPSNNINRATEIKIRCKFENLTDYDQAAFIEYLTYEQKNNERIPVFYLNWNIAMKGKKSSGRSYKIVEIKSGEDASGPNLDPEARMLLQATYLRPLRDAERALSSGRGSRLSQILQNTQEISEEGISFDQKQGPPEDPYNLNVLGIGDYTDDLLQKNKGVQNARDRLNQEYLENLSFIGDNLKGIISVSGSNRDSNTRLRQLLEKLELFLQEDNEGNVQHNQGLGSNNLMFMACELLLLGSEQEGFPLLLIEEPEAHLHPQRQLRLIQFLQNEIKKEREDNQNIQIIITTHSPNLASKIDLNNMIMLHDGKAFDLAEGKTKLEPSDYGFLKRFLDVTKANMFFARGVMIVEGDAENILLPTLASLLNKDFTEYGVSIVNVGGTGLRRYARIYKRKLADNGIMKIPVACLTDLDVMPNCAPEIMKKIDKGAQIPPLNDRKWKVYEDFDEKELDDYRQKIKDKASGQSVATFVADKWTLEFDLAYSGLSKEVWIAANMAKDDEKLSNNEINKDDVIHQAQESYQKISEYYLSDKEKLSTRIYRLVLSSSVSKATMAQYLSNILIDKKETESKNSDWFREHLPKYIVDAIDYVTEQNSLRNE